MSFFDRMLGKNNNPNKGSGATAKDRLKMVLTHDRIKVSPEKMREMQAEIIAVIARYIPEIDANSVDIAIEQSDRYQNKLVAEIPFTKERGAALDDDNDGNDDLIPTDEDKDEALLVLADEQDTAIVPEVIEDEDETLQSRPHDE
ncbi:MAG: cell division topological specificity factor MinE [Anaerolineae bacterium]